jgi:hypothetical protein
VSKLYLFYGFKNKNMINQYKKYFAEILNKVLPEIPLDDIISLIEIPPADIS